MLVRIVSSAFNPGSIFASDPVARITFFAFTWLFWPRLTSTVCTPSLRRPVSRPSPEIRDLVLLHQEVEALHVLRDDGVLARQHRGPVSVGASTP
jgi:hypothetical protein